MTSSHFFITGQLSFSSRKITLESNGVSYFVRTRSLGESYVHGDIVRARIVKKHDSSHLAEVDIVGFVRRSSENLLGHFVMNNNQIFFEILTDQGKYQKKYTSLPLGYILGDIISFRFNGKGDPIFLGTFGGKSDFDLEERVLFHLAGIRTEFGIKGIEEGKKIESEAMLIANSQKNRVNFSDWYTITIDGSDAKDLDDAISLKLNDRGNFLLAVHIADVSEYVQEGSELDREAYGCTTSIYTPGKVIPMLPEMLSNNLCSLQPKTKKLTLSCVMEVNEMGKVVHTDIVESIIISQHRGIYEEIQNIKDSLGDKAEPKNELEKIILLGYKLFEILQKRRKKEGKILFESTELYFDFNSGGVDTVRIPKNIRKRTRTDAHKLIEEFMILANEEVAKWCEIQGVPFLSRVHALPGFEQLYLIGQIIRSQNNPGKKDLIVTKKDQKTITPLYIRNFLGTLVNDTDLYRLSRLLLPKMAKAQYSDKRYMHFGLALEYYAHFTSPIRRYPDLQIHRIIKEKLHGNLTEMRVNHYKNLLKKVAKNCSSGERSAEDISRVFNDLYACRYMQKYIGKQYAGKISGMTEFAIFVELENGIEGTIYIPKRKFITNPILGTLENSFGKVIHKIGEEIMIKVLQVDMKERRIIFDKVL